MIVMQFPHDRIDSLNGRYGILRPADCAQHATRTTSRAKEEHIFYSLSLNFQSPTRSKMMSRDKLGRLTGGLPVYGGGTGR